MKRKVILIIIGLVVGAAAAFTGWLVLPANLLGALVIFVGVAYFLGGTIVLAFGRAPQQMASLPASDKTLFYLAPGALLVVLAAPLEYHFVTHALPASRWMQWLGAAILLLGFAMRIWTRLALKGDYQGNLQVRPNQQLITSGPYRWVRHPGYLGFIVSAAGLVIGFSSLIGLLGVALLTVGFLLRSQVEERMLIQAFGEQYIRYARRTGRMLPRFHTFTQHRKIRRKLG